MSALAPRTIFGRPFFGAAKCIPKRDTLLLPYQAKWVQDNSRLKICEKSRQIGWTWATAYRLVSRKGLADARLDSWISSRDDIQAKLFIQDCKNFASLLDAGAQDLGERVIDDKGHSASVLRMANGLTLNSMSSNPDAQAGKRGDRVLDEFALHPDPRKLYAIAKPGITWGGSMEIFSTHRGSQNYFNELIREVLERGNPKRFSLHRVTLQDALDQGFLYKLQCKLPEDDEIQLMDEAAYFDFTKDGCPDEETFRQEYMCDPADDAAAFLEYAIITGCEYRTGEYNPLPVSRWHEVQGQLFLGMDIGRTGDPSQIWVNELLGDTEYTRLIVPMKKARFSEQEAVLWEMLEHPKLVRGCIDSTGLGMQFAERAHDKFGYKVEPCPFTPAFKESIAYPLRGAMEDKRLRIPADQAIRADLRGIKKETTASGAIRFAGERTVDGHSDRFWALALAHHAAKAPSAPGKFSTVRSGRSGRAGRALSERLNRSILA